MSKFAQRRRTKVAHVPEPDILKGRNPEGVFQRAVLEEVNQILMDGKREGSLIDYFILEKFGLDLAVFMKHVENRTSLRLLELKAFVGSRQGGVGFGAQRGEGPQVDLLGLKGQQLGLADQFIRWIVVDGTKPSGTDRFAIFDNKGGKDAAMGGVRKGKAEQPTDR